MQREPTGVVIATDDIVGSGRLVCSAHEFRAPARWWRQGGTEPGQRVNAQSSLSEDFFFLMSIRIIRKTETLSLKKFSF